MAKKTKTPTTLGEKLVATPSTKPIGPLFVLYILAVSLVAAILALFMSQSFIVAGGVAVACAFVFTKIVRAKKHEGKRHFLLLNDHQGFMGSLKLADKTAVFDGSNIYHFGLHNNVGVKALRNLIRNQAAGRSRIVCFFDANIFFTLQENNGFPKKQRFSISILEDLFDLKASEIYVVPSGSQADRYIIETVSLLPNAFAVTNDRFRDYAPEYSFLTKNQNWRRGVTMNSGSANTATPKRKKRRRKK